MFPAMHRYWSRWSLLNPHDIDVLVRVGYAIYTTLFRLFFSCTLMRRQIFVWCVSINPDRIRGVNIIQFVVVIATMWTVDHIVSIAFRSSCHIADTVAADVVLAASRHEYGIEISKTNRAVILVEFLLLFVCWVKVSDKNVFLIDFCLNSHFVPLSNLLQLFFSPLHLIQLCIQSEELMVVLDLSVHALSRRIRKVLKVLLEVSVHP